MALSWPWQKRPRTAGRAPPSTLHPACAGGMRGLAVIFRCINYMGNSLGKVKKGTTHREATNWNRVIALRERAASALLSREGLRCCEDGRNLSGGYRDLICRFAA